MPLPWLSATLGPSGLPWRRRIVVAPSDRVTAWVSRGAGGISEGERRIGKFMPTG